MHQYQGLLKRFLTVRIHDFRSRQNYTQETMADVLCIAVRSYAALEHGEYGLSASSFAMFLVALTDEEVICLVHDLREEISKVQLQ